MYWACVHRYEQWCDVARTLLANDIAPDDVEWRVGGDFAPLHDETAAIKASAHLIRLPRRLVNLLQALSCYRHDERWTLMYRLAWRLGHAPRLLEDAADPDVHRAQSMYRAVQRDVHKMHAFVRFREVTDATDAKIYAAWFEPQHEILRLATPFFCKRFRNMSWLIATPDGAARWFDRRLAFIAAPGRASLPDSDAQEQLWRTYYRSICNVARINPAAMAREMPRHYWRNLPETPEIHSLLRDGRTHFERRQAEVAPPPAPLPQAMQRALPLSLDEIGGPVACRRCDIWRKATQAVLGEGPMPAPIMLVGEQPGDEEDLRGRPFVGPAGKELDSALQAAGVARERVFVTNAVKHFKWEPRGKRRLHRRPEVSEILACNHWLRTEITHVAPRVIVTLGSSALRAVAGTPMTIEQARQLMLRHISGTRVVATYHPAAILRADPRTAARMRAQLIADLQRARTLVDEH